MAYRRRPAAVGIHFIVAAGLLWAGSVAVGADWPQWRGPKRDGTTPESSGYPGGWPPKRLWSKNVGVGCTSPIIVAGRLYVMGWTGKSKSIKRPGGTDTVFCLDARTGKLYWKQSYPCRHHGRFRRTDLHFYGGPSPTPAFDKKTGYLHTLSIDGDLRCWDARKDGRGVWAKNLYDEYHVGPRLKVRGDYGYTSSPLIQGDWVIVDVGAKEGTVMAFDKATGRWRWASVLTGSAGHSSGPVALTVGDKRCLASLTLTKLVVMRTDRGHEGKTVAEYPWSTRYAMNIATPVVLGNLIALTSAYNYHKTDLIEISGGRVRKKWTSKYHAEVGSPVIQKGRVYLIHKRLHCLDLATGKLKWRGGNFGFGTCLATGDNKIIAFGKGNLTLLEALPKEDKYRELGLVTKITKTYCYPHVALSDGVICCKDRAGKVICFSVGPRPANRALPRREGRV